VRGYRLARTVPHLIDSQIEALGAAHREVPASSLWAMAPMISTPVEAADFARRARAAGLPTVGVMVEVPSAAICAAEIVAEVDFVSIGTNDLAQYTMGADRLRGELADLLSPWQPAILQLIGTVAAAGRLAQKPVGVCGESAADPLMALVLVGLGVTSLSMAPSAIPAVRHAVRAHSLQTCRELARLALEATTPDAARNVVLRSMSADVRADLSLGRETVLLLDA